MIPKWLIQRGELHKIEQGEDAGDNFGSLFFFKEISLFPSDSFDQNNIEFYKKRSSMKYTNIKSFQIANPLAQSLKIKKNVWILNSTTLYCEISSVYQKRKRKYIREFYISAIMLLLLLCVSLYFLLAMLKTRRH